MMMMCVVNFLNRGLKIKLGVEKSDWPACDANDPELTGTVAVRSAIDGRYRVV